MFGLRLQIASFKTKVIAHADLHYCLPLCISSMMYYTSRIGHCLPLPACVCLCHLHVLCSPDASLLAWHVQLAVMEIICVHVEYSKLVDLLFPSHSSTAFNTAGNEIHTAHSFGGISCGRETPHRRAEAG